MEPSQQESRPDHDSIGSRYADVGHRISNWTSNLLATAIVIVIALVSGSQLVSYWLPVESLRELTEFDLSDAWPALDSCSLEFGAAPFQLVRERAVGDEAGVISILQDRCRQALENSATPPAEFGPEEAKMIANASNWIPVEQREGKWRIFHSRKMIGVDEGPDLNSQVPIVIGIRDDCPNSEQSSTSGSTSRLVVWGIALAGDEETWTTFVGQASANGETSRLRKDWIPGFSRRTLAISDARGGSLIGFSGGSAADTIEFYDALAKKNNWTMSHPWQQSNQTWVARFTPASDSSIAGIQVQLQLNHNEPTRGLLLFQSKSITQRK